MFFTGFCLGIITAFLLGCMGLVWGTFIKEHPGVEETVKTGSLLFGKPLSSSPPRKKPKYTTEEEEARREAREPRERF